MICPGCDTPNPDSAKFCMNCGTLLVRRCPNCETEAPDEAKFCLECGHQLDQPAEDEATDALERYIPPELMRKLDSARQRGGMHGERRNVTILFCDVKGSTAAAEKLDPEEWAEIMNGAFEHLIAPVYRYEGTLARLMGDAVLAFFGAPIAHEDDPERAILAGLAITREIRPYADQVKRKWGVDLDVRVGINTGLVVVGEFGSDMRLEYTAMGDAVNLAARMEQNAEPGTVLVSEHTHDMVEPLFDFQDRDTITVKGKEDPVAVYRVLGRKAKPGQLRGIEGLDSPMVGRDAELATLRGAVDAVRRGTGRVASVMAEAGLGKSRLVAELRQQLDAEDVLEHIGWHEGRSLSYQTSTPYAPVAELISRVAELPSAPDERREALRRCVDEVVGEAADQVFPYLASLLGLALDDDERERVKYQEPSDLARHVRNAVVVFTEYLCQRRPQVFVFEDLHWADSASLEVVDALTRVPERASLMLVLVFRPRRQEPSWQIHETTARELSHRYTPITLQPLGESDARDLVASLLRIEGLPESLRALILEKAEGNPFYVEEVIRSLLDTGAIVQKDEHFVATREIEDIELPETLAALLNTRLDTLDDTARAVAQTASVLGRAFEFDTLASVFEPLDALNEALRVLQQRGLVREKARVPTRRYAFKHVLTQEAAYESVLLKDRRALHKRVADVLVRIDPDAVQEIARHYMAAREPEVALPYVVQAGEQAAAAYSVPEAIGYFDQAIQILESGVPSAGLARRAFEGRGLALELIMDIEKAVAHYEAMAEFASAAGYGPMEVSAHNKLGNLYANYLGDLETSTRHLDQAEALAVAVDCKEGLAEGSMVRCVIHTVQAEFDEAYAFLDRAVKIGESLEAEEPVLYGSTHISNTLVLMTEFDRAATKVRETIQLAESYGNLKYLAELKALAFPMVLMREGDVDGAVAAATEAAEIAEQIGAAMPLCEASVTLGKIATTQGRLEQAVALNERAVAAGRATGVPFLEGMALCTLGTSYLHVSERLTDKVVEAHTQALETMKKPGGKAFAAMNWTEVGMCALQMGKPDSALGLFEQGLTMKSAPMYLVKPDLHIGAALAHLQQGQLDSAIDHARQAREFAESREMRSYYPFLELVDGYTSAATEDVDRAIRHFTEAVDWADRLSFRPTLWQAAAEAAALLDANGGSQEAEALRERGRAAVDEIAGFFTDERMREEYVERAMGRLAGRPA